LCGKPLVVDSCREELLDLFRGTAKNNELPRVHGVVATLLKVLHVIKTVVDADAYKLNAG